MRRAGIATVGILAAATCAPAGDARPNELDDLFGDELAVIDLTHPLSADAPYWPGPERSPFVHDTLVAHPDGSPAMAAYSVPEHFGTHFDAPVHGGMGLPSVDRVPTSQLFGPAVVIDVTEAARSDPDYELSADDLRAWEERHGRIPTGAIVLMRSGWARRWFQGDRYYNRDADGVLHFPGFSEEAARLLVEDRDIAGIGVDTGSVDPGDARGFPVHSIVNGAGHFHLENLADLGALPESGAYLIVAPIKIQGGSGGQARVFAVLREAPRSAPDLHASLLDPSDPSWAESAPDTFRVNVETSRGDFTIEVVRAWAPRGADRFYNLVRHGYYDGARFHRVVPGFITQWGIAGSSEASAVWYARGMPDDPVVASNTRGTIAYAFTEPGTRSTQVYINMVDNTRLDAQGFAPFGRVVRGMDAVVDSLYSGYGERSGGGVRRGEQQRLVAEGNRYLDTAFPKLDRLIRASILEPSR